MTTAINPINPANETKKYYGEVTVSIVVESPLDLVNLQSQLDSDGLRARLEFLTGDDATHDTEVLDVIETNWESFED